MTITEITNTFFSKERWPLMPDSEKERHGFNIIRFISIRFPQQVNIMNHKDMNIVDALNFWHSYLTPRIKSTPSWFWVTSGKNKEKLKKEKKEKRLIDTFEKQLIVQYCNHKGMDYQMLLDYFEMTPDEITKDIKKYKELYHTKQ
jgi:hypothetical protein